MYRSYHDPNMTRAIARQDEALEDLIQSTRRVIRKHSTYLAHNNDDNYHHQQRRSSKSRPQTQQQQCTHHCCQDNIKPIQPRTYTHAPPPVPQPPQQKQQLPPKSRTKTWLNKIMPSKQQYETDDEVGLHDLKKKIHSQKSKQQQQQQQQQYQQLPHVKSTGRPMIIPSVSSSPEKIIVVDVPADTTVILRSIDADDANNKIAAMYHVSDMSIIDKLFGHVQIKESKSAGDIKASAGKTMSKSYTMQPSCIKTSPIQVESGPNTSTSTTSTATLLNHHDRSHQQPKPKGMARYMSMPTQLHLKAQKFNYMDSDASTADYRGDTSPCSRSSTESSITDYNSYSTMKHEHLAAADNNNNNVQSWMR